MRLIQALEIIDDLVAGPGPLPKPWRVGALGWRQVEFAGAPTLNLVRSTDYQWAGGRL